MKDTEIKSGSSAISTWFYRNLYWISFVIFVTGIGSVGSLSGYYIGVTEVDVTIVAAVITILAAAVGSTLWVIVSFSSASTAMAGVLLIVFAASTFSGTLWGINDKEDHALEELASRPHIRAQYLIECAHAEALYDINGYREALGLSPLPDLTLCE